MTLKNISEETQKIRYVIFIPYFLSVYKYLPLIILRIHYNTMSSAKSFSLVSLRRIYVESSLVGKQKTENVGRKIQFN